jgi:hypothetical protein
MKCSPRLLPPLILCSAVAHAAEYHVSPTGADTNDGLSPSTAWRSVVRALRSNNNLVTAGDTITVAAGTYVGVVNVGKSGVAGAPITLRAAPGTRPVLSGQGVNVTSSQAGALLHCNGRQHLVIQGMTFADLTTTNSGAVPKGIFIQGASSDIHLLDCEVRAIRQNRTTRPLDAHGILVSGNNATPITNITIENCFVHDLSLGSSEAVVLNGNVDGFLIQNNTVCNVDNIGIDLIGFENTSPVPALDRARNGVVVGNTVFNVDTSKNIAYESNPATPGLRFRSAAGIYADGATNCVLERNHVYACNYGIEVASERATDGLCDFITVRNNLLRHNHGTGLIVGGYAAGLGTTRDCQFHHNTLYQNASLTASQFDSQVVIQHNFTNNSFTHNVVTNSPLHTLGQMIAVTAHPLGAANIFDWNCYHNSNTTLEFGMRNALGAFDYFTLATWRTATLGDANSLSTTNPGFYGGLPSSATAQPVDFVPTAASVLTDRGDPAATPGELDLLGNSRLVNLRTDIGCLEHTPLTGTAWERFRLLYFGPLPDSMSLSQANDDADSDGYSNLLEYSQGTNPRMPNGQVAPQPQRVGTQIRFYYFKSPAATGLSYRLQTSNSTGGPWTDVSGPEAAAGGNLVYRSATTSPNRRFLRLWVSQ